MTPRLFVWLVCCASALHRASAVDGWVLGDAAAATWRRTSNELAAFDASCRDGEAAKQWETADRAATKRERVLVFDVRHGFWVGLGDSLSRVNALLRAGRWTGRATYLWADGCADRDGPGRMAKTRRANGTECSFDVGAWFHTAGSLDWRWSLRKRRVMQLKHRHETALAYTCVKEAREGCVHSRLSDAAGVVVYEDEGPTRVLQYLTAHPAAWLRVELTSVDDLRDAGDALPRDGRCETFMNLRPTNELWRTLGDYVRFMDAWRGVVVLAVRTGYADHVDMFPELADATPEPFSQLERLFQPCPPGTTPVTRFATPGEPPCVHYQTHADSTPFSPDASAVRRCGAAADEWLEGKLSPLKAYVLCAAAAARAVAKGTDAWGVLVTSDSPAVRRAVRAWLGDGHTLLVPSPPGHVQYTADAEVARAAASDFYLAGLADDAVRVFSSYFIDSARSRAFTLTERPGVFIEHAWPHWFVAGNERAMGREKVSLDVMRALS